MSFISSKVAIAALIALPLLGSASSALAQEAIALETIGAVRMVSPAEAQSLDAARHRSTGTHQSTSNEKMWFTDVYATAYYTLDQGRHELVARFEAGPKGGNPIVVRRTLDDGAVESISIKGTAANSIRSKLVVTRRAGGLDANVTTQPAAEHQASN